MRAFLTAVAVAAITAASARADGPIADGNWILSTVSPIGESAAFILKVETKDKVQSASVVFVPKRGQGAAPKLEIRDFKSTAADVSFKVRQLNNDILFVGAVGKDAKLVLGSFGIDPRPQRAKLTATDKEELTAAEANTRTPVEPYTKAVTAQNKPLVLQFQARQEKDADKKKDILAKIPDARKEAEEQFPKLMWEVIAEHADTPAAYDAAFSLLRSSTKSKVTAEEATKLVAAIDAEAAKYGPRFARAALIQSADVLANDKTLAAVAVPVGEKATKTLTDADPAAFQFDVLSSYKTALDNAGKTDVAKTIEARMTVIDAKLDKEFLETVPPFKPAVAAGRKEKAANKVAVMELFTGAQCPPCVAADVAFDALAKTYKPSEVILLQYHLHIPGPDPLTNPDTVARMDYYMALSKKGSPSTPTTAFNGKLEAGGGGGMANSESKYKQYLGLIEPILEKTTPVAVAGTATRGGDKIDVSVNVTGADEKDGLKVRFVLVEDHLKYVGGNKLRFHHQVVRALPGGAAGFPVKAGASKHTVTVDVAEVKKGLTKYLDGFAKETPFPKPDRPMDLAHLKLVVLVQNDETGEIVQAAQIEVSEKAASNR